MTSLPQDSSNNDECIICFESHQDETSESKTKEVSTMPFIITNCECKYNCHEKCLQEWINNNPRCLLCDAPVVTMPSITDSGLIQRASIIPLAQPLLNDNRILAHHPPPPAYHVAIAESHNVDDNMSPVMTLRPAESLAHANIRQDIQENNIVANAQSSSFYKCYVYTLFSMILFGFMIKFLG